MTQNTELASHCPLTKKQFRFELPLQHSVHTNTQAHIYRKNVVAAVNSQ